MTRRCGRGLRALLESRSGHFALLTAFTAPVAVVLAAVAVDAGSLYLEKRRAQALSDLAAITAAANLGRAEQAARVTMTDNGVTRLGFGTDDDRLSVVTGRYDGDANVTAHERFIPGGTPANAAKVAYRTFGTRYFGTVLIPPPEIAVESIAGTAVEAAFSVGSRLLSVEGGVLNALLEGLTGSIVSLSAMDYNALLSADVSLLSFLDALAVELELTAGSYREVLDAEVTLGQVARALSNAPDAPGNAQMAAARLAGQTGGRGAPGLQLSRLIGADSITRLAIEQVGADINALELVTLSAILAGKGKQVALGSAISVPGLLSVSVDLAVGEPPQHAPWFRIGSGGELVRTAQTRLAVTAEIANEKSLVGLLGARIRIPLYLELAYAEARLNDVTCAGGRPENVTVTVDARPGIANLYLAEVDRGRIGNFANPAPRSPARLIQIPLVTVTGEANAEMSNVAYRTLTFTATDIAARRIKQVETRDYVTSLTRSLFSSLDLEVKVELGLLGIPLVKLPSNVTGLLGGTIGAAAPALDSVLHTLLSTLGLSLGQADVRVHGASCGRAVLVQ